ncbi:MAG TPA: hypothetical protein VFB22_14545 [Candidatus Baltobacteraceae bacterium]|nr:hypothetical protein [Candidatus Baltobacteraceae bacterium]
MTELAAILRLWSRGRGCLAVEWRTALPIAAEITRATQRDIFASPTSRGRRSDFSAARTRHWVLYRDTDPYEHLDEAVMNG